MRTSGPKRSDSVHNITPFFKIALSSVLDIVYPVMRATAEKRAPGERRTINEKGTTGGGFGGDET